MDEMTKRRIHAAVARDAIERIGLKAFVYLMNRLCADDYSNIEEVLNDIARLKD